MSVLKGESMADPIKDYARAVAEEVRDSMLRYLCRRDRQYVEDNLDDYGIDAIIASVPTPAVHAAEEAQAQHHAAPTPDRLAITAANQPIVSQQRRKAAVERRLRWPS